MDPLEKGMATQSSYSCVEDLHGWRSLGYSPWGLKESDTTKQLSTYNTKSLMCSRQRKLAADSQAETT